MGQKVNPTGFRIGVNKNHLSTWYSDSKNYAKQLTEDIKVRAFIEKKIGNSGVAEVKISRNLSNVLIEIIVARPGVVIGRGGKGIEDLKKALDKILGLKTDLKVLEAKNAASNAQIIAHNVAEQIGRRVAPRIAMSREIENVKTVRGIKGVRIAVSGRIKGQEIARTEKVTFGAIPLQTLRADIDYALVHAQVPNAGTQGIKVWVYKGEKRDRD